MHACIHRNTMTELDEVITLCAAMTTSRNTGGDVTAVLQTKSFWEL